MEALKIIAESWPIAVMAVGISAAVVVRRSLYQAMNNDRLEKLDRSRGNQAVVVRDRYSDEG